MLYDAIFLYAAIREVELGKAVRIGL